MRSIQFTDKNILQKNLCKFTEVNQEKKQKRVIKQNIHWQKREWQEYFASE